MRYFIVQKQVKIQGLKVLFIKDSLNRLVFTLLFISFFRYNTKILKIMQKTSSFLLNIQATLIDPSFSKEANIGECIRLIINKCKESQEIAEAWDFLQDYAKAFKQDSPNASIMLGDIFEI